MEDKSKLEGCFWGLLTVVHVIARLVLTPFTVSVLWQWFMVPVTMLPGINLFQASGLYLLVAFLTKQTVYCVDKEPDAVKRKIRDTVEPYIKNFMVLTFGFAIHYLNSL